MARPRKCRRVCSAPSFDRFSPAGETGGDTIHMAVDEYEVIRLIDLEGLTQEECAEQMAVSRGTVQSIYAEARKKLAQCIVEGYHLRIGGGDVRLCEHRTHTCGLGCCHRREETLTPVEQTEFGSKTGGTTMRIAVTYEDGQIFQHFGHTERFKVYDIEDGKVAIASVVNTNGSGHGALADILKKGQVDTLICGGIGGGAKQALADAGIALYGGASGDADKAVEDFLAGKLEYNADAVCNHHGEHHGEGHTCGDHHHGEGHTCGNH